MIVLTGKTTVALGIFINWLDQVAVDGTVRICYRFLGAMGNFFRSWQTGKVQAHLLGLLVLLVLVGVFLSGMLTG